MAAEEKRAILGGAGAVVVEASNAGADSSSELARSAVTAATVAIALSQTYAAAQAAHRSPTWSDQDDHFAYLIYRGNEGRTIGRLVWAGQPGPGFMETESLRRWVQLSAARDMESPTSSVGSMLRARGGARLHKSFR